MINPTQKMVLKKTFPEAFKKEERDNYIADFPDLVDLVGDDGRIKFLLFDGTATETYILQDNEYHCPQQKQLPPNMQIPRLDEVLAYAQKHDISGESGDLGVCTECTNLYEKLLEVHQTISELPDPGLYHVLALWDFHTHCMEKANYSPIIYFFSVAERGKSRTVKAMTWIARRGIRKGDIRDAQLIRDCTHLRASIAFDMTDFWDSVTSSGSRDVVLNRYEKGLTVSRVNRPEKGAFQDTDFYDVFGPTVLATNEIIQEIADTRSLPIVMVKSTRDFEDDVVPETFLPYLEQLVAWRMVHLRDEWEKPRKIAKSRLGDIIRPLHQILLNIAPQYEESLINIVNNISKTKLTERSNGLVADILLSMGRAENFSSETGIPALVNGVLSCQIVTNLLNEGKDEKERFRSRRVGTIIKSLGFKSTPTSNHTLGFFWKGDLLTRLLVEYGVSISPNEKERIHIHETPESPESPESENTNIPDNITPDQAYEDLFDKAKEIFGVIE
jgi:hypothetical protein